MEAIYNRLENIYNEMTQQLQHFREELDNLKDNTTTKYVEKKDTKWEGFTLETAKSYLYTSNVKLRSFGYHAYINDAQKRNIALKDAVKYYGKEFVEKKLLALICVWSTNAVHNKEYVHLLNHLQIDYAAMKSLP